MQDAQLVGAIVEGDRQGWAELYQRYADPLYTYCVAQLQDRDAAADVLHDTLIVAAERVSQLRDPERLRPWLYAIARNECHRRRRSLRRLVALEEAGDVPEPVEDVDTGLRLDETRRLVRDAVEGLNPSEREVLQLAGSHGLSGPELALALGVSGNHANALLSRARQQFEKSLAALIVARTGREACAVLDDMLHGWDGQLSPLLRKRIARHIENCQTCGENKKRRVNAKQLLTLIPLLAAGAELLERTTQDIENPELVSYRRDLADRAGTFRRNGFPVGNELWRRPPWVTIAAVSTGIAVLAAYAFLAPIQADQKEALPPAGHQRSRVGSAALHHDRGDEHHRHDDRGPDDHGDHVANGRAAQGRHHDGCDNNQDDNQHHDDNHDHDNPADVVEQRSPRRTQRHTTRDPTRLGQGLRHHHLEGGTARMERQQLQPHVTVSPGGGTLATNGSVTVTVAQTAFDNSGGSTLTFTATGGQSITVSATWTVIS